MKSIVDPQTAKSERSNRTDTNHPWRILCLSSDHAVVKESAATGFTHARKAVPRIVDKRVTVKVVIAGPRHEAPFKFHDLFTKVHVRGEGELYGFLVPIGG